MKKLPGCDAERMYYDASDRLVFRQDGNLRQSGRRQFFLYDALGREAVRGTCKATAGFADGNIVCATYTGSGLFDGYSADIDLADVELMQTTYYDDYAFLTRLPVNERTSLTFASRSGYSGKSSNTRGLPTGSVMHQLDDTGSYTVSASYYDALGRVVCQRSTNHLGGAEVTHTNYTFTGKTKKTYHIHTAEGHTDLTEEHIFSYDHADRLISEQLSVNGGTAVKISRFKYNSIGQIASKTFGNGQAVKYSYNLRGWTTGISNRLFSETLAYNTDVGGLSPCNPVYNGNIAALRWKSDNLWRGYQFRYDRMGRLVDAVYGEGSSVSANKGRFSEKLSYDMMGNVLSVQRSGKFSENVYAPIDDLTMEYEGNRLVKADDAVDGPYYAGAFHFVDGADEEVEYSYDANGNVTSDLNKNITQIDYNCLNLPSMIRFGDGSKYMSMKYDAAGRLLRRTTRVPFEDIAVSGKLQHERAKADLAALSSRFFARNGAAATATSTAGSSSGSSASPSLAPSTTLQGTPSSASSSVVPAISGKVSMRTFGMTDYDYCGNVEYTNDKAVLYHSEGYVTFDKEQQPEFHYYLKDHLGNIRVVFNERDSVEQVTHYYPFGGSFGDGVGSSVQDYLYSGKELTRFNALNWYNYGARWYDPAILHWNGVDKLAEKYTTVSPYTFCLDNPVRYIDPDGKKVYLYATTLPGTNIPFATHTFIVITDNKDNVKKYFAFGSEYDGIKGATGGRLMQRIYNQDIDVYNGNDTEHIKAKIPISTPANMKDEEFENRISEVAESFGNNESITYMFIPIKETQGNCNTSSSTLLLKSGLSPKDLENLNKLIPGVVTGFDSYTRPWTKKEQEEAVLRERKVNEIKKEIGGH